MNPIIHAMKLNPEPIRSDGNNPTGCAIQFAPAVIPTNFRRLKSHEVVSRGDYVVDQTRGLEPWEGPSGFRAGSFIKLIYRRIKIKGRPMTVKSCL